MQWGSEEVKRLIFNIPDSLNIESQFSQRMNVLVPSLESNLTKPSSICHYNINNTCSKCPLKWGSFNCPLCKIYGLRVTSNSSWLREFYGSRTWRKWAMPINMVCGDKPLEVFIRWKMVLPLMAAFHQRLRSSLSGPFTHVMLAGEAQRAEKPP